MAGAEPSRVLVVADDAVTRAGLVALLREGGCLVVGAVSRRAAGPAISRELPSVIVCDIVADATDWFDDILRHQDWPPALVLLRDDGDIRSAVACGARAVMSREVTPEVLRAAVDAVEQGLAVMEPDALTALFPSRPDVDGTVTDALTSREREVLALLAEGLSNRGIAARLGISEHTAKFHVTAVMAKLDVQKRTEAVTRAIRLGLVVL